MFPFDPPENIRKPLLKLYLFFKDFHVMCLPATFAAGPPNILPPTDDFG